MGLNIVQGKIVYTVAAGAKRAKARLKLQDEARQALYASAPKVPRLSRQVVRRSQRKTLKAAMRKAARDVIKNRRQHAQKAPA